MLSKDISDLSDHTTAIKKQLSHASLSNNKMTSFDTRRTNKENLVESEYYGDKL